MQNYHQKLKPLIIIAIVMLIFSALDGKITNQEWYTFGVLCLLVIPFWPMWDINTLLISPLIYTALFTWLQSLADKQPPPE